MSSKIIVTFMLMLLASIDAAYAHPDDYIPGAEETDQAME